jgi:hypothetical protein
MKRKTISILFISAIVLVAMFGFMGVANAAVSGDGNVEFEVSINPTQVFGPQNVNVTINVYALNGKEFSDVSISQGSENLTGFAINDPARKKYVGSVSVAESEIGDSKLVFTANYELTDGSSGKVNVAKTVLKMAPVKSLSYSYKVDRKYTEFGNKIGFVFTIKNTGSKTLSDLKIRDDNLNGGSWLAGGITIEPGETRVITYNHTMSKNITVQPLLRYNAGGTTYNENFSSTNLELVVDDVEVTVTADKTNAVAGEEVSFTVRIKNNGSVYLRKLTLYNHNNEVVKLKGDVLRKGDAVSVITTAVFKESDSVQFDITAEDAYGSIYSHASNIIEIDVPINFNPEDLTISAKPEFTTLAEPGLATFNVLLTNKSDYGLYDIKIVDTKTGDELKTITHLEKGERLLRVKTQVDESRNVSFRVEALDAAGNMHTVDTTNEPIVMTVISSQTTKAPEETIEPEPTPEPEPQTLIEKMSTWVIALIIIGVLILFVIISLSALVAKEKGRQKRGASTPTPKKETIKSSSVPKKRPGAPKKKKYKKRSNIRVSYRDKNNF